VSSSYLTISTVGGKAFVVSRVWTKDVNFSRLSYSSGSERSSDVGFVGLFLLGFFGISTNGILVYKKLSWSRSAIYSIILEVYYGFTFGF
jgi:hypothetical protein